MRRLISTYTYRSAAVRRGGYLDLDGHILSHILKNNFLGDFNCKRLEHNVSKVKEN